MSSQDLPLHRSRGLSEDRNNQPPDDVTPFDDFKTLGDNSHLKPLDISTKSFEGRHLSLIWTQVGQDIDGDNWNDYSGRALSLSSDGLRVAIGAHKSDGGGEISGQVKVYDFDIFKVKTYT